MRERLTERTVESAGALLTYYTGGNPEAADHLLFLNGLYHGHQAWVRQIRQAFVRRRFRLLFLDYRGTGRSRSGPSPATFDELVLDVQQVVEKENVARLHLIGYSVGGGIALAFVSRYPQRVRSLVLLNSGVCSPHATRLIRGLQQVLAEGASLEAALLMAYPWHHSRDYLEKLSSMEGEVLRSYAAHNRDHQALCGLLQALARGAAATDGLERITVPTTLICAEEDHLFPAGMQHQLTPLLADWSMHLVPRCGHASFIECPDQVNALLEKHLAARDRGSCKEED